MSQVIISCPRPARVSPARAGPPRSMRMPQINVVLGPELLEKVNTAVWWAGFGAGAVCMFMLLVILYLMAHQGAKT